MTVPETTELRAMSDGDLAKELEDSHQALFNLRFQTATRQLADVSQVHNARRRIARIKTLLTERDILVEADAVLAADEAGDTASASTDEAVEESTEDSSDKPAGDAAKAEDAADAADDESDEETDEGDEE